LVKDLDSVAAAGDFVWANAGQKRAVAVWAQSDMLGAGLRLVKGRRLECLSLPAGDWIWESGLAEQMPNRRLVFYGVERDPGVHKLMRKGVARAPHNAEFVAYESPMTLGAFAVRHPHLRLDVIFADWCGPWGRAKAAELHTILSNGMLRPGGFLLLTVCLARVRPTTVRELVAISKGEGVVGFSNVRDLRPPPKHDPDYKGHPESVVRGLPSAIMEMARSHGMSLEPVSLYMYANHGSRCHTPMCFMSFRRIEA